ERRGAARSARPDHAPCEGRALAGRAAEGAGTERLPLQPRGQGALDRAGRLRGALRAAHLEGQAGGRGLQQRRPARRARAARSQWRRRAAIRPERGGARDVPADPGALGPGARDRAAHERPRAAAGRPPGPDRTARPELTGPRSGHGDQVRLADVVVQRLAVLVAVVEAHLRGVVAGRVDVVRAAVAPREATEVELPVAVVVREEIELVAL